jgi:hypothetical protein
MAGLVDFLVAVAAGVAVILVLRGVSHAVGSGTHRP